MSSPDQPLRSDCPISYSLEIFGDRWTLIVLRDLLLKSRYRYNELAAAEEKIATNVLADRLARLERRGLIVKSRDPGDARRFVYRPTETAVALVPMLVEMIVWGVRTSGLHPDSGFVRRYETDRDGLVADMCAGIRANAGLDT